MVAVSRRDFVKYAAGGAAAIVVGSKLGWMLNNPAYAQVPVTQPLRFQIGDAIKQMVTHNAGNPALCYFWLYKSNLPALPAEVPGPTIFATLGDTISIEVTNSLDEPHTLSCPSLGVNSAEIPPLGVATINIVASKPGAHLYYDNLNEPVNRVMGLHGAIIVMPRDTDRIAGHKLTPYSNAAAQLPIDHAVQRLFDDFGTAPHFPGLAWETADTNPATRAEPLRTYVWLDHQASPVLFQEVGSMAPGAIMNSNAFIQAFLRDPFNADATLSRRPQFFTINGQSGFFGHSNPIICPNLRVGEPCIVHILNAGLWTHSMHLHANHFYVTFVDGVVMDNPLWCDTFEVEPLERVDYVIPYVRPPDVPNVRGIGLPDAPMTSSTAPAHPVWPATDELILNFGGVQLSPMCFPMHDHSEPSQTAQGGNYNLGLIAGMNFIGDRNIDAEIPGGFTPPAGSGVVKAPNGVVTFPNAPAESPLNATGPAAPPF